jgi:hypothetical protein
MDALIELLIFDPEFDLNPEVRNIIHSSLDVDRSNPAEAFCTI